MQHDQKKLQSIVDVLNKYYRGKCFGDYCVTGFYIPWNDDNTPIFFDGFVLITMTYTYKKKNYNDFCSLLDFVGTIDLMFNLFVAIDDKSPR